MQYIWGEFLLKTFDSSDWAMVFLVVLVLSLFVGQATGVLPTKSAPAKTTMTWDTPTAKSYSIIQTKKSPNAVVTAEDLK